MNKPQWITAGIAFLLLIVLYFATSGSLFGERKAKTSAMEAHQAAEGYSTDSVLYYAKQYITPQQATRLNALENSISRGDVANQRLQVLHQLAHFWKDSARIFAPYAYYEAEAARLENSENSLTFAAHLFLDNLNTDEDPKLRQWQALQAKDLLERSLKINPANDSSKVALGSLYVFSGIGPPMEGIQLIRGVAEKDTGNVYAQMTLGKASLMSGQVDKALERFKAVVAADPKNVEATLLLADTYERSKKNAEAIEWYRKSLPLVANPEFKKEVEQRIKNLKN